LRKDILEVRSKILQAVRKFFIDRSFIEVETPVRISVPALELHIDAEVSGDAFLRTSPELHMKRLLVEGHEKIFQMGPCFRRGEKGNQHNPEYTMLEWYRADANYTDVLLDTKALLAFVFEEVLGTTSIQYRGTTIDLLPVWDAVTVEEAFILAAGWNPMSDYDADRFDMDLVQKVEPWLAKERPSILKDYPAEAAALAKCRAGEKPVAERWELFVGGMELANAFTELCDPVEQRQRFEECAESRRKLGKDVYEVDEAFLSALEEGMPEAGGVALGIDRLVMLLTDSESIDHVMAFPETP
jgi:lysyl-tRNA synthetase class 2